MALTIWHLLIYLNLFKSSAEQAQTQITYQRWSTRGYLLLLVLAFSILIIYNLFIAEMRSIEVNNPSFTTVKQLQSQSINGLITSLQCSCSKVSISYGNFIQFQPSFHQVCSSDFISTNWIDAVTNSVTGNDGIFGLDFANNGPLFQLLSSLCELSNNTVVNSLKKFQETQLVNAQLLTEDLFDIQVLSIINQFILQTTNKFLRFLQLYSNITFVNQLLSGEFKNFLIKVSNASIPVPVITVRSLNSNNATCLCANDIYCKTPSAIYRLNGPIATVLYYVVGFYAACFPIQALRMSTLECFYDNQHCLNDMIRIYNNSNLNVTRLNSSYNASRFPINSTISNSLEQLFIESWNPTSIYLSYFTQCQLSYCTYQISQPYSVTETITRIVALTGGLTISLRIIALVIAALVIHLLQRHQIEQSIELVTFSRKIYVWAKKLNVFDTVMNNKTIEEQRRGTRVYLVLLSITLLIFGLNNLLIYSSFITVIYNPSLEEYEQLQQQYSIDAINCPCFHFSIPYSSFIELEFDLHQVCGSEFVSDWYIKELFQIYNQLNYFHAKWNAFTLQGTCFTQFQTLAVLCSHVKDIINDGRQQFLASSVISANIIDNSALNTQINTSLMKFQSTLPNVFLNTFHLLRGMIQSNGMVSSYSTNWYLQMKDVVQYATVYFHPQFYNNCNCATSSTCTQSSTPFILGYFVGCTPLESLLQSTFECFYNQSCVDLLVTYLNISLPSSIVTLNKNETRFSMNDTIESIVEEIFIERWLSNISYAKFFEQCKPVACYITVTHRNSFLFAVTTVLGLQGGLVTFFKLVVPWLLLSVEKLAQRFMPRTQSRVHTTMAVFT
ncbi:unnamed protein product [Adineta ricciae]|uniref:Transmembrane protein n=1 Tax=Adineta ricciae TaxID=249248 RepID=A0A815PA53_ADIRI|nr:unnamed protein product [Adineta ricciae]CAF1446143.1 unnamed protein product [Adineta ricciae]